MCIEGLGMDVRRACEVNGEDSSWSCFKDCWMLVNARPILTAARADRVYLKERAWWLEDEGAGGEDGGCIDQVLLPISAECDLTSCKSIRLRLL